MFEFWYDKRAEAMSHANDEPENVEEYGEKKQILDMMRNVLAGKDPDFESIVMTVYDKDCEPLIVKDYDSKDVVTLKENGYIGIDFIPRKCKKKNGVSRLTAQHIIHKDPIVVTEAQAECVNSIDDSKPCELYEIMMSTKTFKDIMNTNDEILDFVMLHITIPF